MLNLPEEISRYLTGMQYKQNKTGRSQAGVYRFFKETGETAYYLKIEPKQHSELHKEYINLLWMNNHLPVPDIIAWHSDREFEYLLLSEIPGETLCEGFYIKDPALMVSVLAKGILRLHSTDISGCPLVNSLEVKLRDAEENIMRNLVDMDDWNSDTSPRFASTSELLDYLKSNRPAHDDFVFTHGDYCPPNILGIGFNLSGFIDNGRAGIADRWQDIALCVHSLWHMYDTNEYDTLLLEQIGVPLDREKLDYYILLDELF